MSAIVENQNQEAQEPEDTSIGADGLKLSQGQQDAFDKFVGWLMDPDDPIFVLEGYAGTGKTTLVKTIMQRLPKLRAMLKLLDPQAREKTLEITATTNKAAEVFSQIMGMPCATIHSFLGLMVETDWNTRETRLVQNKIKRITNTLLVVDEGSYLDGHVLEWFFKIVDLSSCKVMFMGDPAQLLQVGCFQPPVFNMNYTTAKLTELMRQAKGNPIQELSTLFRKAVETKQWFSFAPDGHHIKHLPRPEFETRIIEEFSRKDWKYSDSKVLAWTNKCVISYNHAIRERVKGDPNFAKGDYAVNNKYIANNKFKLATDQLVQITDISSPVERHGVMGRDYMIDGRQSFFMPDSREVWKGMLRQWKADGNSELLDQVERTWIDLRAAFAQTINKSQGSTYDKVFIDLDDVKRCNSADQLARMLYVGTSRARHEVIFTGDLV